MTALVLITVGLCALWVLAAEGVRRACVRALRSPAQAAPVPMTPAPAAVAARQAPHPIVVGVSG